MSVELRSVKVSALCAIPCFITLFSILGPFLTDTVYLYSGVAVDVGSRALPGYPTIDPNVGFTSFALGARAALDVISGHLPLWNHYEGLGTPLLGEMQSAALYPPTWLLALPHGQEMEQAFLQLVAGAGAFLFFKKFGLSTKAALAGSLLFEVNGVFAWLRNAIYNPVAFLPWLFFAVEGMRAAALAKRSMLQRLPLICVGAIIGTLALYAGFPEEVYLYSLLLMVWIAFRAAALSGRQNLIFVSDLMLSGLIALGLSAPLLVAFTDFLDEAALGAHGGNGFYGSWLNPGAIIQYITPYLFGPIFASTQTVNDLIWGGIGGYVGFTPIVIALASLFVPHQRAVKILLAGWIAIALGASHGLPAVYQAFMTLPLAKMAACYRYLNTSWIFCIIFLCALFIDRIPALPQRMLRRILIGAVLCGVLFIVVSAAEAWPLIFESWKSSNRYAFIVGSLLVVALLSFSVLGAAGLSSTERRATVLSSILIAEAMAWFLLPYLSAPRHGSVDVEVISFLRANIGYQRVVDATGASLSPNYGSYFGIPLLNYNDLPAPKTTAQYIKTILDPYADPNIFIPDWPKPNADRNQVFRERLSRYAEAGVKYVLAGPDFNSSSAFPISSTEEKLVHQGRSMNVYELPNTRGYFSAASCALISLSHDWVDASCANPSKLVRLELSMRGWSATVNGQPVSIGVSDGVFQTIDLPAGKVRVEFTYEPPGFKLALAAAGAALLLVLAVFASVICRTRARRPRGGGHNWESCARFGSTR